MDEKTALVYRWLRSSFVSGGSVSDRLYDMSKGNFDAAMPFEGLGDPESVLYTVDDICKALSTTGETGELFNALTVLYAVKKGIRLDFDASGCLVGHDDTEDETFHILFTATVAIKGADYKFRDVSNLYRIVSGLDPKAYPAHYPGFIEAVKNKCKALNGGTVALPRFFISKTIGDIVRQHGCKSVYNPFAGVGGLLLGLDPDVEYVGQEAYGIYSIFSRVLADAYGYENASFEVGNPLADWSDKQYDAVIFNLPTDCYFDDYEKYVYKDKAYDDLHETVFNMILEKRTAKKIAIGLVRYPFIRSDSFKELRRRLFEEGLLDSVICLPEKGVFSDSLIKTAIIVLDFENKHDTSVFYRGDYALAHNHSAYSAIRSGGYDIIDETPEPFRRSVNGPVLEYFDWKYISAIYANPVACNDDEQACFITNIASVIPPKKTKTKSGNIVSSSCFSPLFFEVLNKRNKYDSEEILVGMPSEVSGPCVLFRLSSEKIEACVIRAGETVIYDSYNIYAIRPKEEKVSLEYLAYALVTSQEFRHYLADCTEYDADNRVPDNVLEFGKLAIITDLGAQKQFVNEIQKKYLITKKKTYNIIWASDFWLPSDNKKITDKQNAILTTVSRFGIRVIATPSTASRLAQSLVSHIDECASSANRADAVFLDADIRYGLQDEEAYDGLDYAIELKDRYAGKKIPFYLFTESSFEDISNAKIKSRRLEYFKNRYFNSAAPEDAVESLCLKFQDEMSVLGSREAEMRSKYARVFRAADRYNEGNIQRVLTEALDEEFSNELSLKDTEDKFNKLRQIAEDLLKNLAKKGIVPDIKFGAQVDFLADGRFDDLSGTARFYHADKKLMSDTLSLAFRYFKQLVAGGSHKAFGGNLLDVVEYVSKESKNSDLYKSALYILMDILLWYERILDKAEADPDSVVGSFTSVPRGKPETGIVSKDVDGSLICGHTRLNTNGQSIIKEGDTVKIRKKYVDTRNPTETVWFYAQPDDYAVVPSAA